MQLASITCLLKKELPQLQGVYLFGSFATGHETKTSDVDIAILCQKRLSSKIKFHVISQLENLLQKTVDLVELRFINTIFQEEILRTSKRILAINEMVCERFEDYVFCSAMDFREFRKPHSLEIIARGSVYGD